MSKKTNSSPMISLIDRTNPAASDTAKPCMVQTLGRRNSKRVRFTLYYYYLENMYHISI